MAESAVYLQARVIQKVATEAEWQDINLDPLIDGELYLYRDVDGTPRNFKIGDGVNQPRDIPYFFDASIRVPFFGTATPASTPSPASGDGFWIATEAGTYTNYGGVVLPANSFGIITRVGTTYGILIATIDLSGLVSINDFNSFKTSIGVMTFTTGQNILGDINQPFSNTEIWGSGFLRNTGVITPDANWYHTNKYYPIVQGSYVSNNYETGNSHILIYDINKNVIQAITNISNSSGSSNTTFTVTSPNSRFIRISKALVQNSVTTFINSSQNISFISSNIFATPELLEARLSTTNAATLASANTYTDTKFTNFGFITVPANTNFLSELTSSSVVDITLWADGFLNATGAVQPGASWHYSIKYYTVYPGVYRLRNRFSGNARVLIYNESKQVILAISSASTNFDANITIPELGRYIRISYNGDDTTIGNILLSNNSVIYYNSKITGIQNIISENNDSIPVSGLAVASNFKNYLKGINPAKSKVPIISFVADDGGIFGDTWYVPLFNSRGLKSTFAIITGRFGNDYPDFYNKEQVIDLYNQGHDIAGHTKNHLPLAEQTSGDLELQVRDCKTSLLSIVENCEMFVAPYGSRNFTVDATVRKYFKTDFISQADSTVAAGTCCNTSPVNSLVLKRIKFDAEANGISRIDICKQAVDVCLANSEWLVFAVHPHFPEYTPEGNPTGYLERQAELTELLDYIESLGISIMSAKQAFKIWSNPVQIGNVGVDSVYYTLGMDGTEAGTFFKQ